MDYYSYRKYVLQGEERTFEDGCHIDNITWYDYDLDVRRSLNDVVIEQIGENLISLSDKNVGCLEDIWICDIINIY